MEYNEHVNDEICVSTIKFIHSEKIDVNIFKIPEGYKIGN